METIVSITKGGKKCNARRRASNPVSGTRCSDATKPATLQRISSRKATALSVATITYRQWIYRHHHHRRHQYHQQHIRISVGQMMKRLAESPTVPE